MAARLSVIVLLMRPRGDWNSYLQYRDIGLFPVYTPAVLAARSRGKLPGPLWPAFTERHKTESLRQIAKEYGVSHEAVRRAIARAKGSAADKELPGNQSS